MFVLGIWDGHDSGAALIQNGRIISAANEERFTKRKLEVRFPFNSVLFCLKKAHVKPKDIKHIAVASSDFSTFLTRVFPKIKDNYYPIRRRLKKPNLLSPLNRPLLNNFGRLKQNKVFRLISTNRIRKNLFRLGFSNDIKVNIVEHHLAHASSTFYCSGFKKSICITMDALGDGISSTVNICKGTDINRVSETKTKDSLGLMYQEATDLLGMRILEDEGKLMSLADYSNKAFTKNFLENLYSIKELKIKSKKTMEKRWRILKDLCKNHSREDFAFMVQYTLEKNIKKLVSNAISAYDIGNVCCAGGVFSNIKANSSIKGLDGLKEIFIFPQMGDGGLAAGAALYVSSQILGTKPYKLENVYLGPKYLDSDIKEQLEAYKNKLSFEKIDDKEKYCAEILNKNEVVFWFDEGMEYGPRALGARSILARPDIEENKNYLNKIIKRRSKFQPFCPSMLHNDAKKYLFGYNSPEKFMTMAYKIDERHKDELKAVIHVDNTTRPQTVGRDNKSYYKLLKEFRKKSGIGALLNTSFNIHGYPIVCSPKDAIDTLIASKNKYLMIGSWFVKR